MDGNVEVSQVIVVRNGVNARNPGSPKESLISQSDHQNKVDRACRTVPPSGAPFP